jgi:predicted ATPase/class 3 adenylate cyclase
MLQETTLPSAPLTFLFTDIEGSTRLWETYTDDMPDALARHESLLRGAIESHHGKVFKNTGDGMLAVFPNALNASAAALAGQSALANESWGATGPLRVRMAIHTGQAQERQGDYFGPALNRAARLLAVGHGGQTLLSQASQIMIGDQLPAEISLRDLGERRLKDLARPERIFQLVSPDLPSEFPQLKTIEAYPNNLPSQLTSFIGREKEIDQIKRLLEHPVGELSTGPGVHGAPLVSLVGPGGTGKTRLALQAAAELLEAFPDGVWLVELAPLSDSALVTPTVAATFNLSQDPKHGSESLLAEHLIAKHLLLILDNCEHLIDACAKLVDGLLHHCPLLHILTTSREPLGITGETILRVPSLSMPDLAHAAQAEQLTQFESVRLFIERAQSAQPGFQMTNENCFQIAQICQRLDGIPLAIELAAARINLLTVDQINLRLKDRFRLLTGGSRVSLPRHQTLSALIDWSYELLNEAERILLRRLAVFAGGWTLEAAEQVCCGEGLETEEVLEQLAGLVNKSLVVTELDNADHARYDYLETIQQYAYARLLEAGEAEGARNRHLEYFLRQSEQGENELYGPNQLHWFDLLEEDHDNYRGAMEWALESEQALAALRIPGALHYFWFVRGYRIEGVERSEHALERFRDLEDTPELAWARAKAYIGAGFLATWAVLDFENGKDLLEHGLSLARRIGDRRLTARALDFLAYVMIAQEGYPQARILLLEALEHYQALQDPNHAGRTRCFIGDTFYLEGQLLEAGEYYKAGLQAFRQTEDANLQTYGTRRLGYVYLGLKQPDKAKPLFAESLRLNIALKENQGIASCLMAFANLAFYRGELELAGRLVGATEMILTTYHTTLLLMDAILKERYVPELRKRMGEAAFIANHAVGEALSVDGAIALANNLE